MPQKAPPMAPAPTRFTACLTLTLPSCRRTTTAASARSMSCSFCSPTSLSRICSALASSLNASTTIVAIV